MARYGSNFDRSYPRGYGYQGGGYGGRGEAAGYGGDYYGGYGYQAGALEGYGGGTSWWGERDLGWSGARGGPRGGYGERGYGGYGATGRDLGTAYRGGMAGDLGAQDTRWGGGADYGGYASGYGTRYGADREIGGYTGRDWDTQPGTARGWTGGRRYDTAGDLMTENPESVTPDTTLADVAKRMRDLDVGIMPVVESADSDVLQGVITDRDIAVRAAAEGKDMTKAKVSDFMTSDVSTCTRNDDVRHVFDVMKSEQVRRVPIVDDDNRLIGIIAQADLAVDYAGDFDLQHEAEVEEVVERVSEPGHPRWGREFRPGGRYVAGGPRGEDWRYAGGAGGYDRDLGDRVREGWRSLKRGAQEMLNRGYDRGMR